jgi:hypothetical protein
LTHSLGILKNRLVSSEAGGETLPRYILKKSRLVSAGALW